MIPVIGSCQSELEGFSAETPFARTPCHSNAGKTRWQHSLIFGSSSLSAQVVNFMFPQILLCFYSTDPNKVFGFHYTVCSPDFCTLFLIP